MRKLLIVFLSVLGFNYVSAQDNHFVYIQSENHKPFYLRINSKLFQASGDGYLLVPGLSKTNYQLYIGVDNPPAPEWKFNCEVVSEDLAYTLKSSAKGLELVPLGKTANISGIKEDPKPEKKQAVEKTPVLTGPASDDAFSMMLSGVVNDPTIRERTALIQREALVVKEVKEPVSEPVKDAPAETPSAKTNNVLPEPITTNTTKNATADSTKNATASLSSDLINGLSKKDSSTTSKPISSTIKDTKATTATVADAPPVVKQNEPVAKKDSQVVVRENATVTAAPSESFVIEEVKTADKKTADTKTPVTEPKTVPGENKPVVPASGNESFVIKETLKPAVVEPAVPANKQETKTNAAETPFVIKEVKAAEKNKTENKPAIPETAVSNTAASVKNTNEPFVVKEVTAASKKDNNPVVEKNTTSAGVPKEDKPFVVKETVPAVRTDDKKSTNQDSQTFVIKETVKTPALKTNSPVSSTIKKTLQRKSADGIELIYVEEYADGSKDTIRILIPAK